MHLRFDLLFEHYLAALEDFLNVRTQLARVRINNREFLLNPESKGVLLGAHSGAGMSLKNHELSSRVGKSGILPDSAARLPAWRRLFDIFGRQAARQPRGRCLSFEIA